MGKQKTPGGRGKKPALPPPPASPKALPVHEPMKEPSDPPRRASDLAGAARLALGAALAALGLAIGVLVGRTMPALRSPPAPPHAKARAVASVAAPSASASSASSSGAPSVRVAQPPRKRPPTSVPGPWGTLELLDVRLDVPAEYVTPDLCSAEIPPWAFVELDRKGLARLLDEARLDPALRAKIEGGMRCEAKTGCVVPADLELTAALDAHARRVLYTELARHPENPLHFYAFKRKPNEIDEWFEATELSPALGARLRELLFPIGEYLAFADRPLLCSTFSSAEDRRALLRALARTPTLMVSLHVPEGADVERIADYWNTSTRRKDIVPLLESLAERKGGGSIDIAHLLPAFARARLFTYPSPEEMPWNCHWTSLNFLRREPDDRFLDTEIVQKTIEREYEAIDRAEARLGDVVVFTTKSGRVLHSATYIAGDVLFTKNGSHFRRPWVLMRLDDVVAGYFGSGVNVYWFRRKAGLEEGRAATPQRKGRARAGSGGPE